MGGKSYITLAVLCVGNLCRMQADAEEYDKIKLERQLGARRRDEEHDAKDDGERGNRDLELEPAKFIEEMNAKVYSGGASGESLESRIGKYAARRQRGNTDEHQFL